MVILYKVTLLDGWVKMMCDGLGGAYDRIQN